MTGTARLRALCRQRSPRLSFSGSCMKICRPLAGILNTIQRDKCCQSSVEWFSRTIEPREASHHQIVVYDVVWQQHVQSVTLSNDKRSLVNRHYLGTAAMFSYRRHRNPLVAHVLCHEEFPENWVRQTHHQLAFTFSCSLMQGRGEAMAGMFT